MLKKLLILTLIIFIGFSITDAQAKKDSRNVLDYFKLIPNHRAYFHSTLLSDAQTKIEVKDTKNGYLKITGAFDGWMEVALFRKKDSSVILLVGENYCGPACGTDLYAYEYDGESMVHINLSILQDLQESELMAKYRRNVNDPNAEMISYLIELPRKGKTIKLNEDVSGDLIYEIDWKNDKFIIHRSVLDYYYLFPQNELDSANARKAQISINDEKNGYLILKVPQSTIEVALFRKTNGSAILLYAENYCGSNRCVTMELKAQEYVDGKWNDITNKVLPDQAEMERKIHSKSVYANKNGYQYKVPRIGTTVNIVEGEYGKTIYKLLWENNKFIVQ